MSDTEGIVWAFGAFGKSGKTALLPERLEPVEASREQLVHIGLVPYVPHENILGCVEHVMQGERQFDYSEARCQVTAVGGYLADDFLANLERQVVQFRDRTSLDVFRRFDVLEEHYLTRVMMNAAIALRMEVSASIPSSCLRDSS